MDLSIFKKTCTTALCRHSVGDATSFRGGMNLRNMFTHVWAYTFEKRTNNQRIRGVYVMELYKSTFTYLLFPL